MPERSTFCCHWISSYCFISLTLTPLVMRKKLPDLFFFSSQLICSFAVEQSLDEESNLLLEEDIHKVKKRRPCYARLC